jgi:hypothetical protein
MDVESEAAAAAPTTHIKTEPAGAQFFSTFYSNSRAMDRKRVHKCARERLSD